MKVLVVVEDDADMRKLIDLTLRADPRLTLDGAAAFPVWTPDGRR